MSRSLSEKRVLKKLGIEDFRHMTKDKVVKFATMLPYLDPEVAKAALAQFPAFKDLARDLVSQYKWVVDRAFEENKISQQFFYDTCNSIISSLQKELDKKSLDASERDRVETRMIEVARMIGEKDSENKGLLLKVLGWFGIGVLAFGALAAGILGSNTQLSRNEDADDSKEA